MGGRLTPGDVCQIWLGAFLAAMALTGVLKYSLIASVFVVTNFLLLTHFMALSPSDEGQNLKHFADGLRVVAHRGAADDQPENTMAAFVYSHKAGAHAIELDVSLTKDHVPVCLHDDTVDRTTDGTGLIREIEWEDARKLNAAAKFQCKTTGKSDVGRFEGIPKLSDVVEMVVSRKMRIFFDVKDCDEKAVTALLDLYQKHPALYRLAAVCSFFHSVVFEVKRRDPRIMVGHTFRHNFYAYADIMGTEERFPNSPPMQFFAAIVDRANVWLINNWLWKFSGAELVLIQERDVSKNTLAEWRSRGVLPVAWTVNEAADKKYFLNTLKEPFMADSLTDLLKVLAAPGLDSIYKNGDLGDSDRMEAVI